MVDCCDPFGGGGVALGVDATEWDVLNEPICDCEKAMPLVDPMLLCEYDMGRLGRPTG